VADLPGVWATGKIQEKSRKNLADIVEGWIVVRQIRGLPIPLIDNPIILI
jgi:predicted RNase H-like HicB family nuclease